MTEILKNFLERLTSRKFLTAAASFTIVLLQGLGYAEFPVEVYGAAAAVLPGYLVVEGVRDAIVASRNSEGVSR